MYVGTVTGGGVLFLLSVSGEPQWWLEFIARRPWCEFNKISTDFRNHGRGSSLSGGRDRGGSCGCGNGMRR